MEEGPAAEAPAEVPEPVEEAPAAPAAEDVPAAPAEPVPEVTEEKPAEKKPAVGNTEDDLDPSGSNDR